jgi:hypothetical protein
MYLINGAKKYGVLSSFSVLASQPECPLADRPAEYIINRPNSLAAIPTEAPVH